jgi:hypothetical protein
MIGTIVRISSFPSAKMRRNINHFALHAPLPRNLPPLTCSQGAGSLSHRRGPASQASESADNRRRVCVRWEFAGTRPAPGRCGTKRIEGPLNFLLRRNEETKNDAKRPKPDAASRFGRLLWDLD